MKFNYQNVLKQYGVVGSFCAAIACSMPSIAQLNDDGSFDLEEIIVTGRKREESLQDIPISISVIGGNELAELNVLRQDDLAALVPGFYYNQGVGLNEDRTAALPSIRGVGSTELATNRSKVASFIDGMPILGSIGAINIGGATQVEVYSGPQSAAFGRSTFAGAINYVTRDPGDTFEGTVGINWSEDGTRIVNGFIGGPITDTLGFQLGASFEDSGTYDDDLYSYTDGVLATEETGENLSARLVFTPNDKFKAKVSFSRDTVDDGPRADFYASAESSFACFNSLTPFTVRGNVGPPTNIAFDGVNECELDVHPDTVLEQLNDYRRHFANNPDILDAIVNTGGPWNDSTGNPATSLRAQGAVDGYLGLTVEEQALIVYDGYSVAHGNSGSESERNRVTGQFDYLFDNGSALQFSIMKSEEELFRGYSRIAAQEVQAIFWNDAAGYYDDYSLAFAMGMYSPNGRRVPDNTPTEIEENYMELRWASPDDDRLRYVVGASYYDYEYNYIDFGAPGYNNLVNGTAELFEQLVDPAELADSNGVVAPTAIESEITTNTAVFFNASYDFSDTLTGSVEGRYAQDEVGAFQPIAGLSDSVTTNSFTPRIALNWTPEGSTTYYAQYAVGVNPAGINAALLAPELRDTLDNGVQVDDTIYGGSINGPVQTVNYDADRYTSFDEEKITNFELGFKGNAFDGRLSYTGAIYYMLWDDALENINLSWDYAYADDDNAGSLVTSVDPTGPPGVYYVDSSEFTSANSLLTNTGQSDTRGIELQASYQISDSWSIGGNFSVMKREFTEYCSEDDFLGFPTELGVYAGLEESVSEGGNPCWVLSGLEVANQPSFTATVIPRYRGEFGDGFRFTAAATFRHTTQHYSDFANVAENPTVNRVNLNLGLSKDAWSAQLYVDNLLDDKKLVPRRATASSRFFDLNAPASIPTDLDLDFAGGPWGSFSLLPNHGRIFGVRLNYDF
jgi:outer membrane receptor protein involved in Fe transport